MKRCAAALLALLMLVLAAALPAFAQEERRFELPEFDLPCRAAILVDQASGTVLYEKQADQPMPIASITKVMTLLLTMEALESGKAALTDIVPVSEHAYNMGGSQIWLEPGEQLTLDEMLKAICVSSANDAAVAVAEYIGGSEPVFVEQMNRKAAELGMSGTHFCNACGLDEAGHLSTARDVAVMSREMLNRHPQITRYTTIWMDSLRGGATQLLNTNKLLKRYSGITGLKPAPPAGRACASAPAPNGRGFRSLRWCWGRPPAPSGLRRPPLCWITAFPILRPGRPRCPPMRPKPFRCAGARPRRCR